MKTRYRLIRRSIRGGGYYCVDSVTGKRISLQTDDEDAAQQIVTAKNQVERQPMLNRTIGMVLSFCVTREPAKSGIYEL